MKAGEERLGGGRENGVVLEMLPKIARLHDYKSHECLGDENHDSHEVWASWEAYQLCFLGNLILGHVSGDRFRLGLCLQRMVLATRSWGWGGYLGPQVGPPQ